MKATLSHLSITNFLVLALIAVSIFSCKTYSEDDLTSFDEKIESYVTKNNFKPVRSESGLYVEVLNEGDSTSRAVSFTSEITIAYKGKLLNGKTVDQSRPDKPFISKLSGLIGGFQEGLFDLHKGARVRLIIPPHLGYGSKQEGPIPANSILVFDIEILEVH